MSTIAEIVGMEVKPGCLGIEIETESTNPYPVPPLAGWKHVTDGSLRDFGIEFVSRQPVKREALGDHLKTWKDGLGALHRNLKTDSHSTSVHVHVNIQQLEPLQLLNFYLSGVLFENVIGKFAGPDREGNLFCLRTRDAEHQFNVLKRSLKHCVYENDIPFQLKSDNYKYANINTGHLLGFGSLEFRIMRGTTDPDEIKVFAEVLHDIREFAKGFNNLQELLSFLKSAGVDGAFQKAFGSNADVFKYTGFEKDISKNFIYLAEMFKSRKTWEFEKGSSKKSLKNQSGEFQWGQPLVAPRAVRANAPMANGAIEWSEDYHLEDM